MHGELLRLRLAEASRLLADTDLPIRVVAVAAGFGSVQYMTTVIKRHSGLTPAQLREAAGPRRGSADSLLPDDSGTVADI